MESQTILRANRVLEKSCYNQQARNILFQMVMLVVMYWWLKITHPCDKPVALLKQLLDSFAAVTGLQINYENSTFVPIGLQHHEAATMAEILGCSVASFPQTYLALPLSIHKLRLRDFSPLIDAVDNNILGWCGKQ